MAFIFWRKFSIGKIEKRAGRMKIFMRRDEAAANLPVASWKLPLAAGDICESTKGEASETFRRKSQRGGRSKGEGAEWE